MENISRVGVRFNREEAEAFGEVARRARERTKGYATLSDIAKELMGLMPLNLLTEKDCEYIRSIWKSRESSSQKKKKYSSTVN